MATEKSCVDLIQGGHEFLCRLDLANGQATALEIPGTDGFHAYSPQQFAGRADISTVRQCR